MKWTTSMSLRRLYSFLFFRILKWSLALTGAEFLGRSLLSNTFRASATDFNRVQSKTSFTTRSISSDSRLTKVLKNAIIYRLVCQCWCRHYEHAESTHLFVDIIRYPKLNHVLTRNRSTAWCWPTFHYVAQLP